ncbi:hypothetical protein ACHAW5_005390 [Stephanodiscus triporus]|uniref:Uncharacterized protein n=1 Tax=Stephanodiscus triporus TaxID=2934178 RepID=A0ABD3P9V4_9STRA
MLSSGLLQRMCLILSAIHLGRSSPRGSLAFSPHPIAGLPSTTTSTTRHPAPSHCAAVATMANLRRDGVDRRAPSSSSLTTPLRMTTSDEKSSSSSSSLPVFLDPGTKGGVVVLSVLLFVLPIIAYNVATGPMGLDEIEVGRDIGVGFSVFTMLLWGSTYIFRVATKDMTYARQLKDYEDAVIAKRLEELDDDEVQALVEDIERERF